MVAFSAALVLLASGLSSLAYASPAEGQTRHRKRVDLSVPGAWRDFATPLVKTQRNMIANNVMNKMLSMGGTPQTVGGLGYWQAANVWSAVVLKDLYAGTFDFMETSLAGLRQTFTMYPNFRQNAFNDDTLWWASSALYAFDAYYDFDALSWAEASWADVARYQVSGTGSSVKSFTWPDTCSGQSSAGAVFWTTTETDDDVNAITTGLFMNLSARLYVVTKDPKYLDAAVAAYNFITKFLYNTSTNLVNDSFALKTCNSGVTAIFTFTYNSGKYIEGLAVLGAVTGDATYINAAIVTATAGMKTTFWQGTNGVITEDAGAAHNANNDGWGFKAVWIRGLAEVYRRNPDNRALQILIHSYIDVQANALMQLASNTGDIAASSFSANWMGPYDGVYAWTQLAALDVFGAFVMVNTP